jgi:hypothetical protein
MSMSPIPGDVAGIRRHAGRYTRTATAINDAIEMLQAVADASRDERSRAVDALADAIGDTRDRLSRVRGRYEVAGSALATFADALESAQQQAASAITAHDDAERRHTYAQSHLGQARTAARQTVDPAELADATDAVRRYSSQSSIAATDLTAAQTSYDSAVAAVASAGDSAATAIAQSIDNDGLNDSAWDNFLDWVNDNAGWISVVKDVLSVVTMIVGALSIFFPVLAPIALGLAAVTAGLSFILAASGSGSWLDFGLDMLGVLTFGLGTAAVGAIKLGSMALRGARSVRLAVTAPRTVFGSTLREVGGNLVERGIVGSVRQPFSMVARESASVIPPRPTLGQVLTRAETPWLTEIGERGHVVIAEFGRVAQQARLGAGGFVQNLIVRGAESATSVYNVTSRVGTGLDVYNAVGIGVNRIGGWAESIAPEGSPVGEIAGTLVDVWNAPGNATTQGMTDWSVTR